MGTKIMKCGGNGCRSEFQDARYGKDMRVHNAGNSVYRCTVCGDVRSRSATEKAA